MRVPITYDYAVKHHPEQVKAVVEKLRSGKSERRDLPEYLLTWQYEIGIAMPAYLFNKPLEDDSEFRALPFEEKVDQLSSRMRVSLRGETGPRWRHQVEVEKREFSQTLRNFAERYISDRF